MKMYNLSVSKIDGYDLQINNLVKYNKENFFQRTPRKDCRNNQRLTNF